MNFILESLGSTVGNVWETFLHNWPYLTIGIIFAAAMRTYVGTTRMSSMLRGKTWITVPAAVLLATFTPFCSCGTEAVVLSLMAGSVPWAPIVTFMVASPLTSPEQFVMSGGYFGWSFATFYFVGATLLGLTAGGITSFIENRGWLRNQARMTVRDMDEKATAKASCGSSTEQAVPELVGAAQGTRTISIPVLAGASGGGGCCPDVTVETSMDTGGGCCGGGPEQALTGPVTFVQRLKLRQLAITIWEVGRKLLLFFFAFSAIGYLLIGLIPTELFTSLLGGHSPFAVLITAALGFPIYITTDGSLPLVASLIHSGMGQGAAIAFLITGAGTSVGAVAGSLVIARWRVIALVIGILMAGGILMGYGAQFMLD